MKRKIIAVIILMILIGTGTYFLLKGGEKGPKYRMVEIDRGDVRATVTATGTVNAVTTVLVGTQVSGTIRDLYVDYNSPVKKGQLLAQIDPATFEARVQEAKANLLLAKANEEKAGASLVDAKRTLARNGMLFTRNLIARSELDTAETSVSVATAQLSAARAQVEQTRASLNYAETNLRYTKILSPVDGTVISRNVDVGQTVAASFQTPTLFNIAQDLTRMQINTSVDEADIGKIQVDQPVEFSVDAYPDMIFEGKIAEVRSAPITVQNVVTYDVVARVDNPDLRLKPGMTANVSIVVAEKKNVLRVSNAALRFRPPDAEIGGKSAPVRGKGQGVWVPTEKNPKRVAVTTGISDGTFTEILSGDLRESQSVIVEVMRDKKKNNAAAQPQTPRMFR
ncbi:efflux RND transporter periplasmic adaptor subunit [Syntrophus aciditrophicus]|uniref:Periplasmic component of efflux system n=1 Tax=Syntrophus aciditrophicus (strain SB) TaxID=56780 RepID=Q2LU94_SYNAS|nr:efflux RND transporter periplasmic adaptor subunit [Syntrophus aciditrophicus]ABC77658.1 periplasmic component of efflux system [Syntrophus aciditrophicus SB]OPY16266.1 MAG: Macrolide export protein MacA [Syntrophus sp. PtaB.Bin075]